jgi:soluble lytic murein transglycosylase
MNGWIYGVRLKKTWPSLFVITFFAMSLVGVLTANAADFLTVTAALIPGLDLRREADLPTVLSTEDAERYRLILLLQQNGQWAAADREIGGLKNSLLMGHVLAQRYLHPQYRSSYAELANWLSLYRDQPEAKVIYGLAMQRLPAGTAPPEKPDTVSLVAQAAVGDSDFAPRSAEGGANSPAALWQTGLADWRAGKFDEAGKQFQSLVKAKGQSAWTVSAAAFWAARAELKSKHPEHVAYWLGIAADRPHTFYGLIARRLLGVDNYFNFDSEPFTDLDAQLIKGMPAGKRALALLEVGDHAAADEELRLLAANGSPNLLRAVAALSDRANLPSLSLQLASILTSRDGRNHDHALYPVPRWTPHGGFTVDRALLFAVMRQESLFAPHVVSTAGARGLMQLMPATAKLMAAQTGETLNAIDRNMRHEELADPEINLTLAQEYIQGLLHDERNNLMFFAIAYNGGPGALEHWKSLQAGYRDDPLLFLESIPAGESRIFTERVLTNYWIYRLRLNQQTPELDALAADLWPTYTALDNPEPDSRHVADNQ